MFGCKDATNVKRLDTMLPELALMNNTAVLCGCVVKLTTFNNEVSHSDLIHYCTQL